jgi:hypothetical protein
MSTVINPQPELTLTVTGGLPTDRVCVAPFHSQTRRAFDGFPTSLTSTYAVSKVADSI